MKAQLFAELAEHPLCEFFLRKCLEDMSDDQVREDLAADPDMSLLQHFQNPDVMGALEMLFIRAMEIFGLSQEALKAQAGFNFDVYDVGGFESVRAVLRVASALSEAGFSQFKFLRGMGLADLEATKEGQRWFIEVKTLILQTKEQAITVNGKPEILIVDKFQPRSHKIEDYVETVSRLLAGNHIQKASDQLRKTVMKLGDAKKMTAIAVNLLAAGFFLDCGNLSEVEARLRGKRDGWDLDYLSDLDALAFLTDQPYIGSCQRL
jgi:hypothetical protein